MTGEEQDLEKRFHAALKRDVKRAPDWMVRWDYQRTLKRRKRTYEDGVVSDFFTFGGAEDLLKWMHWFRTDYPDFIRDERIAGLIEAMRVLTVLKRERKRGDGSTSAHRIPVPRSSRPASGSAPRSCAMRPPP